jgi:hypothetical protein
VVVLDAILKLPEPILSELGSWLLPVAHSSDAKVSNTNSGMPTKLASDLADLSKRGGIYFRQFAPPQAYFLRRGATNPDAITLGKDWSLPRKNVAITEKTSSLSCALQCGSIGNTRRIRPRTRMSGTDGTPTFSIEPATSIVPWCWKTGVTFGQRCH